MHALDSSWPYGPCLPLRRDIGPVPDRVKPGRSIMIRVAYPGPTSWLRSFMEEDRDGTRETGQIAVGRSIRVGKSRELRGPDRHAEQ
jgi:hypothetical protein